MRQLSSKPFPWTRYWSVRTDSPHSPSPATQPETGFLPEQDTQSHVNRAFLDEASPRWPTLTDLLPYSCLILLGRPGSGKTTEIERAIAAEGVFSQDGCIAVHHFARELDLQAGVRKALLSGFDYERAASHPLRLIIDGVDEILVERPNFLDQLKKVLDDELKRRGQCPLKLTFTCRSQRWLGTGLTNLWPQKEVAVADLLQLTQSAAMALATQRLGERANSFWEAIHDLRVQDLAIWPQSLVYLIEEFETNDQLPDSHFDLIRRAAKRQSGEMDAERAKALGCNALDEKKMFHLAARAAAYSLISGNHMLTGGIDPGQSVLSAAELTEKPEKLADEDLLHFKTGDVSDLLERTAHFCPIAEGRFVFAHQLFREHLAAAWLAERRMTVTQLSQLLGYWEGKQWRHYPQLAPVAAWLASDSPQTEWQQFLLDQDAVVFVSADATALPDNRKLDIVTALLKRAEQDKAIDPGIRHHLFKGLSCPRLAGTLRPWLHDISLEKEAAWELAIDIAEAACVTELIPDMWSLLRLGGLRMRWKLASALQTLDDGQQKDHWLEVLHEDIPWDERGRLLGSALQVLVPRHMKVRDVLPWVIPKKKFEFYGDYERAYHHLLNHFEPEDGLSILKHSAANRAAGFDAYSSVEDTLLAKALASVANEPDERQAMETLADWWYEAITYHRHLPKWTGNSPTLADMGFNAPGKRRMFLECAATCKEAPRFKDHWWYDFEDFFKPEEDLEWLANKLEADDASTQTLWAQMLRNQFWNAEQAKQNRQLLERAYNASVELRALLPKPRGDLDIFAEMEMRAEEFSNKSKQRSNQFNDKEANRQKEHQEWLATQFEEARQLFANHDPEAWLYLVHYYTNRENGDHLLLVLDSENEPWMREAARHYLLTYRPHPKSLDGTRGNHRLAATWALNTVFKSLNEAVELFAAVSDYWIPGILLTVQSNCWDTSEFNFEKLLEIFQPKSSQALLDILELEYTHNSSFWILEKTEALWDDSFCESFGAILKRHPPQPEGIQSALEHLAKHNAKAADSLADFWLDRINLDQLNEGETRLIGAILIHLEGRFWNRLRDKFFSDLGWARQIFLSTFHPFGIPLMESFSLDPFTDSCIADFAELLLRCFPLDQEPVDEPGFHQVTALHDAIRFRNAFVAEVGNRGMVNVIEHLEKLKLPQSSYWLARMKIQARSLRSSTVWKPITPARLQAAATAHDFRLSRTNDDLQQAVLIALDQYERHLHTTVDYRLLRESDKRGSKGRHEETLSDHLAQWLRHNYQIEPSREHKTPHGGYTDIGISLSGTYPPLHTIIEVKKDNSELLLKKLKTQLTDAYLNAQGKTHGIYCVFWFEDRASNCHPGVETLEQLQNYLDEQASELSQGGLSIFAKIIDCRIETIVPPSPHSQRKAKKSRSRTT